MTEINEHSGEEQALCIHCAKPYNGLDHFCPHCGGPVSQHSAVDPMGQIYSIGHAYSSATSGRASKLVLIGMWLLFGPQLVCLLIVDVWVVIEMLMPNDPSSPYDTGIRIEAGSSFEEIAKIIMMLALTAFYGILLYKVTAGYVRKKTEKETLAFDD